MSTPFSSVVWASKALEHSLDSLALTSFGVMDTTLEEVFLKVSEEDQSLENSDAGETMFLPCVSGRGVVIYQIDDNRDIKK